MRRALTVAGLTLGIAALVLSESGRRGEAQTAGSPFLGNATRAMTMQPLNLKNVVGGVNTTQMYKPKVPSPLGMGNILPKIPQPSFPPKFASAPQVDPRKNPYQPNNPKGRYIINPTPPTAKSKSNWNFLYNPFKKSTSK